MDRQTAIKKLGKLLGKNLGYRVDQTAPKAEDREAAQAAIPDAIKKRDAARKAQEDRRIAILAADTEYQRLKEEAIAASETVSRLFTVTQHFKITVGTSSPMFFQIEAQGDSWESIIEIITAKKAGK